MEIDGAVKGIAGFRMDCGGMLVFSDVASDVPKMTIWRKAVEFMKMVRHPVMCVATETSGPFLERLGWVKMAKADDGDVYAFNPNESEAG